jgi:nitronate monooxygenase
LISDLKSLGVPLICAGGVGDETVFKKMMDLGYSGVQMGTRFIATTECSVHPDYKAAILDAGADSITTTVKLTGVPVSIIRTPAVEAFGTEAGWLARKLLQHHKWKKLMRLIYSLKSIWSLKRSAFRSHADFWQAGKSVDGIHEILPAGEIVRRFKQASSSC